MGGPEPLVDARGVSILESYSAGEDAGWARLQSDAPKNEQHFQPILEKVPAAGAARGEETIAI